MALPKKLYPINRGSFDRVAILSARFTPER
jgi:hypothetical protein